MTHWTARASSTRSSSCGCLKRPPWRDSIPSRCAFPRAGCAGGVGAAGVRGIHRRRAALAQSARWGHAPGRHLAAAGLYALDHHVERLAEDHANAAHLAEGLRALGLSVEPPETNLVFVEIPEAAVEALRAHLAKLESSHPSRHARALPPTSMRRVPR